MTRRPIQREDLNDPQKVYEYLLEQERETEQLRSRLAFVSDRVGSLKLDIPTAQRIARTLQAGGVAGMSIDALPGKTMHAQNPDIPTLKSLPDPNNSLYTMVVVAGTNIKTLYILNTTALPKKWVKVGDVLDVGTAGTSTPSSVLKVSAGTFSVGNLLLTDLTDLQSFTVVITNTAGTIQHAFRTEDGVAVTPTLATKITGPTQAFNNTPLLTNVVGFVAGGGIDNAAQQDFHLDTIEQMDTTHNIGVAIVVANNALATGLIAEYKLVQLNVNGVVRYRPVIRLRKIVNNTAFTITAANIGAGLNVSIKVLASIM